ncbi:MAG: divergent polysaccharide deacetylase family protein [Alphaproteobacteria bacterium]
MGWRAARPICRSSARPRPAGGHRSEAAPPSSEPPAHLGSDPPAPGAIEAEEPHAAAEPDHAPAPAGPDEAHHEGEPAALADAGHGAEPPPQLPRLDVPAAPDAAPAGDHGAQPAPPAAADAAHQQTPPALESGPAPPLLTATLPDATPGMTYQAPPPEAFHPTTDWPVQTPSLHGPMPMLERQPIDLAALGAPPAPEQHGTPDAADAAHPPAGDAADPAGHDQPGATAAEPSQAVHPEPEHAAEPAEPAHAGSSDATAAPEHMADDHGAPDAAPHEPPPADHADAPPVEGHDAPPAAEAQHDAPAHEEPAHAGAGDGHPAEVAVAEQTDAGAHPAEPAEAASTVVAAQDQPHGTDGGTAAEPGTRAVVAVVIGGLGLSGAATEAAIQQLPAAVTLSFSPYSGRLQDWIARARAAGHEVLIDLPMEPADFPNSDPGPQALMTSLDSATNMQRLDWVLSRAESYVGVGSFMGSRFAADAAAMRPVLDAIRARGLLYVDNGQALGNVAASLGAEIGLPVVVSDLRVDRMAARPVIDEALAEIEAMALSDGAAMAFGTAYPVTIERIAAWSQGLARRGIALAPVSALVGR